MCSLRTGHDLFVDACSPLQFTHFLRAPDLQLFGGHVLLHLTHACSFLHCLLVCPIRWQLVHCVCDLSI